MTRRLTSTLGMLAIAAPAGRLRQPGEEECRNADWGRLGHQDGAAELPKSRLAEHAEACRQRLASARWATSGRQAGTRGVLLYLRAIGGLARGSLATATAACAGAATKKPSSGVPGGR